MMLEEFEQRTGFYPTLVQYVAIERAYMEFDGDKDAFCKAYKKNADGIAERIQREVNLDTIKKEQGQAAEVTWRDAEIARRDAEIERLKKELEREQEWKPYEDTHNIPQTQYTELAESVPSGAAHYMTDDEALDWICDEFGVERSKVTILHEVDEYEINRLFWVPIMVCQTITCNPIWTSSASVFAAAPSVPLFWTVWPSPLPILSG